MFYTVQEVAEKLSKSEEQIHELIQEGKLREFRDGTKLLFKVSEVESLASQPPSAASGEPIEILPNEGSAILEPIAEPTPAAAPTPAVEELDIVENADVDLDSDDDDELLLGDFSLEDSQNDLLLEEEPAGEELSLEDSLSLLAGEDISSEASGLDDFSLESDDLLLADDSADELLENDEPLESLAIEDIAEEPAVELTADDTEVATDISIAPQAEVTADDSMDILLSDDEPAESEIAEEISLEATSADENDFILSDESSADISLDDGDSLKLVETTVPIEEKNENEEFDLGDSFDILMDDDSSDPGPVSDGSLLSDDTLGGLLAPDAPTVDGAEDELLSSLTKADTAMGNTGINILAESDSDYQLASDTKADTVVPDDELDDLDDLDDLDMSDGDFLAESAGLGDLDDDLNLDSIGSGSGLLDLSLQADDTSLGAVLDDILPSEDEIEAAPVEIDEGTIADEADEIFEADTDDQPMIPTRATGGQMAARYVTAPATAVDNACGVAMFLPALMLALAAIVLLFGLMGIRPELLNMISGEVAGFAMIWWIVIGTSILFLVILMFGALLGGGSGQKTAKANKGKKTKKTKKTKKPKKAKKTKKKK